MEKKKIKIMTWIALILMLLAMLVYVVTFDDSDPGLVSEVHEGNP